MAYSFSHEDYDDKERGVRRKRHPKGDLTDFKIEAPEFDGNLNPKNYLDFIQYVERIFKLKEYNGENAFKLVILKMKEYASLWHENLQRNRATEVKSKIKAWSKLKKHMEKRFLPSFYKQNCTSRSLLLAKRISRLRSILESLNNSK